MNTETTVAPDVATQNPASEPVQSPEVTTPETQAEETQPQSVETEESRAEKAAKALERRLGKRTADLYRTRAELERAERELSQLRQQPSQEPASQEQIDPHELAKELVRIERVNEKSNQIAKDGGKRFEKFLDVVAELQAEAGPMFDKTGKPTALGDALLDADDPAGVMHYLGTNPEVAAELAELTPAQLGRRIGRIETDMKAKPTISSAPKPLPPVKASASQSGPRDEDDIITWTKKERARMAAMGRKF